MSNESNEDALLEAIQKTYENFEKHDEKLEKIPTDAKTVFSRILSLIQEVKDLFADPDKFYTCLFSADVSLSDVEGNVQHMVVKIELEREKIRKPTELVEQMMSQLRMPQTSTSVLPATINVQAAQPEKVKGMSVWGMMAENKKTKLLEQQLKMQREAPTLTSSQKPKDILDYGRDVTAEYNKLVNYFHRGLAIVKTFPKNQETRDFMNEEIRCFVVKLGNVIMSFSRAITEYRKEANAERAQSYALALSVVKQAEYMGLGGMDQATLYRIARQGMGSENAGR